MEEACPDWYPYVQWGFRKNMQFPCLYVIVEVTELPCGYCSDFGIEGPTAPTRSGGPIKRGGFLPLRHWTGESWNWFVNEFTVTHASQAALGGQSGAGACGASCKWSTRVRFVDIKRVEAPE